MLNIELNHQEWDELTKLVENALSETKVELRRTRNPEWREKLQEEENILDSLLGRLRESEVNVP